MSECQHNRLQRCEDYDGSTAYYLCDECKQLFTISIEPYTITAEFGTPPRKQTS